MYEFKSDGWYLDGERIEGPHALELPPEMIERRKRIEMIRETVQLFDWRWHFAGNDTDRLAIFYKPDLLIATSEDQTLRVCDFTHKGSYAFLKFNDERPVRIETDLDSTEGMSPIEYFLYCALHGRGNITAKAEAAFQRCWDETAEFKPLPMKEETDDGTLPLDTPFDR